MQVARAAHVARARHHVIELVWKLARDRGERDAR
jgi:hypothetical protein